MENNKERYFVDLRSGCGAIRDRFHPNYDPEYPGLHQDTIDVIEYIHGLQGDGTWNMKQDDIDFLNKRCNELNSTINPFNLKKLKELLIKKGLTISVAESCTGGNLQSLLTSLDGASVYFNGGITAYNINQKVKHLKVDIKQAEKVDCVSIEISEQMAHESSIMFDSDISIGTTGYITDYLYYTIYMKDVFVTDKLLVNKNLSRMENQKELSMLILERLYINLH